MARPTREDTWRATATIDGTPEGVFDALSGGNATSEGGKHRPGGMGPPIPLGGQQDVENVTLSRLFDLDRDAPRLATWLARRGKAPATVTKQSLDIDGNVFGPPLVYTGTLMNVNPPEHSSTGSDAAMIELEFEMAQVT